MTIHIGMLLYPGLTQLDLTGPFEVFHRVPDTSVHLLWKTLDPVVADSRLRILPDATLATCPDLDVLFVPGGSGQTSLIRDREVLSFLAEQGARARFVTSVCTGSLLLGAAGLLDGYDAATHWAYMDLLPLFGARPVRKRVVVDRNRVTGGGVTAGIDVGLLLAAELSNGSLAKSIQLAIEYDPAPPFHCGHPDVAEAPVVEAMRRVFEPLVKQRADAIRDTGLALPVQSVYPGHRRSG